MKPWFCSQPLCGCRTASNPDIAAAHTDSSIISTMGARAAGTAAARRKNPLVPSPTAAGAVLSKDAANTEIATDSDPPCPSAKVQFPHLLRFACAPLLSQSRRFLVDACAEMDPGTACLVTCNVSAGWHGAPAIFWCPSRNQNASQTPVPKTSWPKCSKSSRKSRKLSESSSFMGTQWSFVKSPLQLRQAVHGPTVVLQCVAIFAAMLSLLSLCRSRSQQLEAQHLLGTCQGLQE